MLVEAAAVAARAIASHLSRWAAATAAAADESGDVEDELASLRFAAEALCRRKLGGMNSSCGATVSESKNAMAAEVRHDRSEHVCYA